jgi:membrane protease YdiL (CAAX protease family)
MIYAGREGISLPSLEDVLSSPGLVMASILGSGVGHVITILLAWLVVTNAGRQPFFRSIGWGWQRGIGPATVLVAFGGVYAANLLFAVVFQWLDMVPKSTPFEQVLNLSFSTRLAISVFAVASAPFVEEVVFRGIIYPTLARRAGRLAGIFIVSALFLGVHIIQYDGAAAFLLPLGLLSLVLTTLRAMSGSILPSYMLHLTFNLVQVVLIMSGVGR